MAADPLDDLALDPNIQARAHALRNGKKPPALAQRFKPEPVTRRKGEFRSAPDAKPMQHSDIANVQFLSIDDARRVLYDAGRENPAVVSLTILKVEQDWQDMLNDGERFVLTAMAARKYAKRNLSPKDRQILVAIVAGKSCEEVKQLHRKLYGQPKDK